MVNFDPLYLITIVSVSIAAVVGVFTIRSEIKKGRDESANRIAGEIRTETQGVKQHIDDKLAIIDSKFTSTDVKISKNKEDIKDIEVDMKQMVFDFKEMCAKLSKHDFIIQDVVPEFKILKEDFYTFKMAVDLKLAPKEKIQP